MFVRRYLPSESLAMAINKSLLTHPLRIPLQRYTARAIQIPAGVYRGVDFPLLWGTKPEKLLLAFVNSRAYSGDYERNSFCYANYDLKSV
ncbi:unnamed protein product [Sphagnum balticum]